MALTRSSVSPLAISLDDMFRRKLGAFILLALGLLLLLVLSLFIMLDALFLGSWIIWRCGWLCWFRSFL
jgi:hypothetical protein